MNSESWYKTVEAMQSWPGENEVIGWAVGIVGTSRSGYLTESGEPTYDEKQAMVIPNKYDAIRFAVKYGHEWWGNIALIPVTDGPIQFPTRNGYPLFTIEQGE